MTTMIIERLTGQSLIDYIKDATDKGLSKSDMCLGAGYVKELPFGGTGASFTAFYEALLEAKGVDVEAVAADQAEHYVDYNKMTEDEQNFYDEVSNLFGEKWTHAQQMEFMEELDDLGIKTVEQLNDAYYGCNDEYNAEAYFAEDFMIETGTISEDSPLFSFIDWQQVWDHSFRYDFNTVEFDGETYFFRNS
jgi:hypothetical protein